MISVNLGGVKIGDSTPKNSTTIKTSPDLSVAPQTVRTDLHSPQPKIIDILKQSPNSSLYQDKFLEALERDLKTISPPQVQKIIIAAINKCFERKHNSINFLEAAIKLIRNKQLSSELADTDKLEKILDRSITILDSIKTYNQDGNSVYRFGYWFSQNLESIFKLESYFPEIHRSLISQLKDRKNSKIYHEELKVFGDIKDEQFKILAEFYQENKKIFASDQKSLLRLARIIHALNLYQKDISKDDLTKAHDSQPGLNQFLGGELFKLLLTQLGIKVVKDQNFYKELGNWDLEHVGAMAICSRPDESTSWDGTDLRLIKELTMAKLNGEMATLFDPNIKSKKKATHTIKQASAKLKEILESEKLNYNHWINAHKHIKNKSAKMTDESKKRKSDDYLISIMDPEDYGKNIFIGSRCNSCISLNVDSKSIFYSLADPGTKYILVSRQDSEQNTKVVGYARVFLVKDHSNKTKILIDTLDGLARHFKESINNQIKELAEILGLDQKDIIFERLKGNHLEKFATVYPKRYFTSTVGVQVNAN